MAVLGLSGSVTATGGIFALCAGSELCGLYVSAVLIAGLITVAAIAAALTFPGAFGMGDAKVLFPTIVTSLMFGTSAAVGAFAWVCLVGCVLSVAVLVCTRGDMKARFAFGPVLLSAPYGGIALSTAFGG